jgi:predicted phage baseplate assembly protein
MPATAELEELRKAEGAEAIRASEAATVRRAVWVRWHEVPDFYVSEPRDRHYVLDHLNGEVRFGDGRNGLIPPRGVGNIRLARYQTGGGARGNVPAGALSQLKTTLPYVDQVTNLEPALGGTDAESEEALRARTPRQLRHGGRAVTRDDYHDLALLASPEVARARCVPLWNPAELTLFDPGNEKHRQPGHVTLVIVPRSTDAEPKPSLELIRRVEAFLDEHRLPGAKLHVIGPQYLRINVAAEIVPASLEAATYVQSAVENALTRFLHPVTGGMDGTGWPWGREPSQAALYKAIHAITGVDRVSTLEVTRKRVPDIVSLEKAPYFLVCSGQHAISLRPT